MMVIDLTLSNAFIGIDNREMKSESGFSFAIASQPLQKTVSFIQQFVEAHSQSYLKEVI